MARKMSFDFGLERDPCFKRKFRWLLIIPEVSAEGLQTLPPQKAARPILAFKEMQVEHLSETLYFPSKPDYKPIQITLYDIKKDTEHPVMRWVRRCYDAQEGQWRLPAEAEFIKQAKLEMYDGCGTTIETWVYENAWPQQIDFGDLDMGSSDVVTCDITLRYARAYIQN